ncbi:MAG TPA: GNAT family N-acetyltransferase [Myxococcota bacterium]|nr:GNAT family N-acetyltransferase [Myxococcota bacterium]
MTQGSSLPAGYRVRPAREDDLARLPEIERAAGRLFAGAGLTGPYLADVSDVGDLRAGLAAGALFVAEGPDGAPVGFALAGRVDAEGYLHELDVHPDHGRRGLGAALVAAVLRWARSAGHRRVALRTFRDVPWNAPFYGRLGFRALAPEAIGPELRGLERSEVARGLPVERRLAMARALEPGEAAAEMRPGAAPPLVRLERPGDERAVDRIHAAAFGRRGEAELVSALRREEPSYLGLVATDGAGALVGHVAFSAVSLDAAGPQPSALGLAPLAVLPAAQNTGVGGALVRAGLPACAARGAALVFVLGHASYYPRFGFRPAFDLGFYYARPAPEPSFFVLELQPGAAHAGGRVRYAAAFDRL